MEQLGLRDPNPNRSIDTKTAKPNLSKLHNHSKVLAMEVPRDRSCCKELWARQLPSRSGHGVVEAEGLVVDVAEGRRPGPGQG